MRLTPVSGLAAGQCLAPCAGRTSNTVGRLHVDVVLAGSAGRPHGAGFVRCVFVDVTVEQEETGEGPRVPPRGVGAGRAPHGVRAPHSTRAQVCGDDAAERSEHSERVPSAGESGTRWHVRPRPAPVWTRHGVPKGETRTSQSQRKEQNGCRL